MANVNKSGLANSLGVEFIPYNHNSIHLSDDMVEVMYNSQRIAVINGVSSPLQWTAPNGSNIPLNVIEYIEEQTVSNLI